MIWLLAALTLLSLIYLLGGRPAPLIAREAEARRLIAQYQEHQSLISEPQMQQEADYRLYHELAALLSQKNSIGDARLSNIIYLCIPAAFCAAIFAWQAHSGAEMQRWQRLYAAIDSDIAQHKIYGKDFLSQAPKITAINQRILNAEFFSDSAHQNTPLLVYCQALQRRLERSDPIQLEALGDCYSQLGLFELALPAYERLNLLQPNATAHILAWAQAKTLANPEQPPAPEVIDKLQQLLTLEPNNPLALLFLASAYQQHGEMSKSLPLWQQLLSQLAADDPLYPAVQQAAAKAAEQIKEGQTMPNAAAVEKPAPIAATAAPASAIRYQVEISIDNSLISQLPDSAKLFVMIAPAGERMPLAVKMLRPQAKQNIELSDADSMTGAALADYPQLAIRALLSPAGSVGDSAAISVETAADKAQIQLHIAAP